MAALAYQGRFLCGGALVDKQFVVTAAHCFAKSRNAAHYKVILGTHDFTRGVVVGIKKIIPHPLFNLVFPRAYDVALLVLDRQVKLDKKINIVCLPTSYATRNTRCVVTGWGRTFEGGPHSQTLQEVQVPVWDNARCNQPMFYAGLIHANMLCAGYDYGGYDSCQGDSGGPLVCPVDGKYQLHGIVSWGVGCARQGRPGVYARVSVLSPWILNEIKRNR